MKRSRYLLEFFKDPKVAALGPTSKQVGKKVCEGIEKDRDLNVLELGPGDGVITSRILDSLSRDSRLLAIETNADFCEELRAWKDPRLTVVQASAESFPELMKDHGFDRFDLIVSGIPCSMLSHEVREQLVTDIERKLREGGRAVLYQLSPLMRKYLRKTLEFERTDVRMNGLFPMFIMKARKAHRPDPLERGKGPIDP